MTDKTADLEARLAAQRLVLEWLLEQITADKATATALIDHVGERFPPQDHQEDPGAVPTSAFGDIAATEAELRLLLDPVRARHGLLED
ncbi:hypothetical protein [Aquisalinus flavus]|uniref:Uncharacterized protein n=1 Tax=Aquisalinus flavus TaxID=1526572 RepID=A0A8J2V1H6_9PROT|nr:hypothetical protein [Aquisalinus flavus]MBD0426515.1 hypothetical protein [Aquisalinus flavus]UNE47933.1 hypothetical protein FF099_07675 [Aquisalinus flavus]GGD07331.1 hypothetical protein GCM10011342_15190 [Aquisalinus flavus]